MAILINAHKISKAFAARSLFKELTFSIEDTDHIGLIGPNGAGKTTLLRIFAGAETPDDGNLALQKNLRIGFLQQTPSFKGDATILSTVLEGTDHLEHEWEKTNAAQTLISKYELAGLGELTLVSTLSGGWQRRVALAREVAKSPGLLLLDEPTNHLDVESILWLEDLLKNAPFATITITHDRVFLNRTSNRILELDRRHAGGILSVEGSYLNFLETRTQKMAAQEQREVVLQNTLRRETEWLRQGAQARTTKQQARIDRAHELQESVAELHLRNQNRSAQIDFQGTVQGPKKLIEAKRISKVFGDRKLFSDTSLTLRLGTRIGLLGRNGSGKSTLIRALLGREELTSGSVVLSDQLAVAYFDQKREELNPNLTVAKTLCPAGDHVQYRGASVHIRGYLDRFLFTPEQMDFTVGKLSGGEQSRLLMARLMLTPANLLVLDEPTNDLDVATLTVLEECLTEFPGAVILVSHDRYFLDQVSTQIFSLSPDGGPLIPFADLHQWEQWLKQQTSASTAKATAKPARDASPAKKKLGFLEQRELDGMESAIQKQEARLAELQAESEAKIADLKALRSLTAEMAAAETEISRLYDRWAELTAKAKP